jgi:hypothetical protein
MGVNRHRVEPSQETIDFTQSSDGLIFVEADFARRAM